MLYATYLDKLDQEKHSISCQLTADADQIKNEKKKSGEAVDVYLYSRLR